MPKLTSLRIETDGMLTALVDGGQRFDLGRVQLFDRPRSGPLGVDAGPVVVDYDDRKVEMTPKGCAWLRLNC